MNHNEIHIKYGNATSFHNKSQSRILLPKKVNHGFAFCVSYYSDTFLLLKLPCEESSKPCLKFQISSHESEKEKEKKRGSFGSNDIMVYLKCAQL